MSSGRIQIVNGRGLHRFALLLAGCVVVLIGAGALVTSKQAGLAVPDWPLSYGSLNPPRWWQIENVRAEHGHRLIAGSVALLTMLLAWRFRRREARRWVRRLAYLAVAAVLVQALLGGITVLLFLPLPVSVAHAGLAQLFFCLVVTLAVVTAPAWQRADFALQHAAARRRLARLATALTGGIYLQVLVGAVMRHSGAGLAIPDFPLAFGRLVPPRFDFGIAVHYLHRLNALVVLVGVALTVALVVRRFRRERTLLLPAAALALLVVVQVSLGAAVVLTGKSVLPNTAHVAVGALLLASSLVLTLYGWHGVQVLGQGAAHDSRGQRVESLALNEVPS